MENLTVAEALIALGNGEKITSDALLKNTGYIQLVDKTKLVDIEGDSRSFSIMMTLLKGNNLRIYEEFTYPMWFKNLKGTICKFTNLNDGECLSSKYDRVGIFTDWIEHTDTTHWEQVEEPKKMIKVAKYAFKDDEDWYDTKCFYKNEDEARKDADFPTLRRLDYTEIEVEDYE